MSPAPQLDDIGLWKHPGGGREGLELIEADTVLVLALHPLPASRLWPSGWCLVFSRPHTYARSVPCLVSFPPPLRLIHWFFLTVPKSHLSKKLLLSCSTNDLFLLGTEPRAHMGIPGSR